MLSIVLTGMEIANLMGKDLPCVDGDGKQEFDKIETIKKYIKWGVRLFQIPFMITCVVLAAKLRFIVNNNYSCSDNITNDLLDNIGD